MGACTQNVDMRGWQASCTNACQELETKLFDDQEQELVTGSQGLSNQAS